MIGKRGQFYLVAAILLVAIVIGLTAIINYSKSTSGKDVESLKSEIQIESSSILDYASKQGLSSTEITADLTNFSKSHIASETDKDLYFLFGTQQGITIVASENVNVSGNVLTEGDLNENSDGTFSNTFTPESPYVIILTLNNFEHDFQLNQGQNFYFIISKESGEEKHIATN